MAQSQSLRPFLLSLMLALSLIAIRSGARKQAALRPSRTRAFPRTRRGSMRP